MATDSDIRELLETTHGSSDYSLHTRLECRRALGLVETDAGSRDNARRYCEGALATRRAR